MTIKALIEFFETYQNVPVEIQDVIDHSVETLGIQDEITLFASDLDPDVLLGMLVRYNESDGLYKPPKRCALVIYNKNVPIEYQRLACCKEIVHLFDVPALVTNSRDEIISLINNLADGFDINALSIGDWQALKDKLALHQALAILFPHEAREDLMTPYNEGKIDEHWIAEHFCIPLEHVEFLMSDGWDTFRKALLEV